MGLPTDATNRKNKTARLVKLKPQDTPDTTYIGAYIDDLGSGTVDYKKAFLSHVDDDDDDTSSPDSDKNTKRGTKAKKRVKTRLVAEERPVNLLPAQDVYPLKADYVQRVKYAKLDPRAKKMAAFGSNKSSVYWGRYYNELMKRRTTSIIRQRAGAGGLVGQNLEDYLAWLEDYGI